MDSDSLNQTYRLLALCARVEGHPRFYEQLNRQLCVFTAWETLPEQAELHGLGSLLWRHLQAAQSPIPVETRRSLRGLYLRNRALYQAHLQTLTEILGLFEMAGLRPLVLKGLALAHQYYPEPALRPVGDIDLLFTTDELRPALQLLARAGYRLAWPNERLKILPRELSADSPARHGISVHLELHHHHPQHRNFNDYSPDDEFTAFQQPPQVLQMNGCAVYTPAALETLRYIDRHTTRHLWDARSGRPLPLKWSADMLALVECHAKDIAWRELRQQNAAFLKRLAVLYSLTPLPETLDGVIPIEQVEPVSGFNQYPGGWPRWPFPTWKKMGLWRYLWRTFQPPSTWWLCFYYGIDKRSAFWYGQVVYRLRLIHLMFWAAIRRVFHLKQQ